MIKEHQTVSIWFVSMSKAKNPIKLFRLVRNICRLIGIHPSSQRNSKCRRFNYRNLSALFSMTAISLSTTAFFIFKADTIQNLGITFFVSVSGFIAVIGYLSFIYKMNNVFSLFKEFDKFIAKSKLQRRCYVRVEQIQLIFSSKL